jgi:hypothetical protein
MVTVVKQWVQQWEPLLHKYGFNCRMRMAWLTHCSQTLTGLSSASAILEWLKLQD